MIKPASSYLVVALCIAACAPVASVYDTASDVGIPAGLIPKCPGVLKNATISAKMMHMLTLVNHRLNHDGQIIRKSMPVIEAAKLLKKDATLDFNKKTVLYAVGFWDSSVFPHSVTMGNVYARKGYNVFVSETFMFLTYIYPKSVRLSKVLGKKYGEFLVKLYNQGLDPDKLELVGISLGAHIVAYAAKHFYAVTGTKPARLTGLDPAGPCFRSLPKEMRLNKDDAQNVDVIHTNIDGFGIAEPLGHVDFYVNGGEFQPSDILYIPCLVICSHVRAIIYWWQALEHPKKFISLQCNSVQDARNANCYNSTQRNYLGIETHFDRPGIYYLSTQNEFPYYRGKDGLIKENEIYTSVVERLNADDNFIV